MPWKVLEVCYALVLEESSNKDGPGVSLLHTGLEGPTFPGIVTVNPEIQFPMVCGCSSGQWTSQHSHFQMACRDNWLIRSEHSGSPSPVPETLLKHHFPSTKTIQLKAEWGSFVLCVRLRQKETWECPPGINVGLRNWAGVNYADAGFLEEY